MESAAENATCLHGSFKRYASCDFESVDCIEDLLAFYESIAPTLYGLAIYRDRPPPLTPLIVTATGTYVPARFKLYAVCDFEP